MGHVGIAHKHSLFVVEDAAQALGSRFRGQHAGTFGQAAAISFFPAKVLGSLGDGGAVITNDDYIFDRVYQLHDHGRDIEGEVRSWGRNSRLDNLQAAILNHNLKTYDNVIARRRNIASLYQARLGQLPELQLPPAPNSNPDHFDIYQNYELQADRRDELKEHLRINGVGTLIQWGGKFLEVLRSIKQARQEDAYGESSLETTTSPSESDEEPDLDKIKEALGGITKLNSLIIRAQELANNFIRMQDLMLRSVTLSGEESDRLLRYQTTWERRLSSAIGELLTLQGKNTK